MCFDCFTMNNTKSIKVGDILVSTWGYDACLADFYKVTARKNKSIYMVPLAKSNTGDWVAGTSAPASPEVPAGPAFRRLVKTCGSYGEYVKGHSDASAFLWNGRPVSTYNHH